MVSRRGVVRAALGGLLLLLGAPAGSSAQPSAKASPSTSVAASTKPAPVDWVAAEWPDVTPVPLAEIVPLEQQRSGMLDRQRWEDVIPIFEKIVRSRAVERGADHLDTYQRVMWLANAEREVGSWAASEKHYRLLLAAMERTQRTGYVLYTHARNALVRLFVDKGDWGAAEPIVRATITKLEQDAPTSPRMPEALRALGAVQRARGQLADAETTLLRALDHVRTHGEPWQRQFTSGEDPSQDRLTESKAKQGEAPLLEDLAAVAADQGKLEEAERYARLAVATNEEGSGPESMATAIARHNLGAVLVQRGREAEAWSEFARSLALREAASGKEHPSLVPVLHSMARLLLAQGKGAEAERAARRALPLIELTNGSDHRRVADVLEDLAEALVSQGRAREALSFEDRAAEIRERDAQVVLAVGSDAQKRLLATRQRKARDAALTIAEAAGSEGAGLALRTVLRDKGRLADASTAELGALRARLDDAGRATLDELAKVTAAISSAAARGEAETLGPEAKERLARLKEQREALSARISDRSAVFRADASLVTVEDVARRLPEDAALVEVVQMRPILLRRTSGASTTRLPWGEPEYKVYVLRAGRVTAIDLGAATEVDRAVSGLRKALADSNQSHDPRPAARAAYDRIFAKIEPAIASASHVLWSPDAALQLVPVGALVGPDGRYLAERLLITHLTSGRDLLRFDDAPPPPRSGPLVIGAPDYGALPGTPSRPASQRAVEQVDLDMRRIGFLPLPSTAVEVAAVAEAIAAKAALTGDLATESAVKWAHAPSVLHLATHGFFLPSSVTEVAPDIDVTGSEAAIALAAESPLVRSGLAFAGANRRASGNEDGILTGLEATSLDLYGTQLVVLSACETGLGVATPGDGVHGLRRAFAVAGAETLVMSLWEVDSGRTRELMAAYYEALAAGAGRSEAMRRAQLGMLAQKATAHPNVWASFIVSGRWSPLRSMSLGARRVDPGPRGCACSLPEWDGSPGSRAIVIMGIAIAAAHSRRVTRRRTSR